MNAVALFRAGALNEAIEVLGADLRKDPLNAKHRTFLFELLCFAGEYDRAEKQLDILTQDSGPSAIGGLLYRAALHAERTRRKMFIDGLLPPPREESSPGSLDDVSFADLRDTDERLGANLEVFIAGSYSWMAFEHIANLEIPKPDKLRDLLWSPAVITPAPSFEGRELGEVLLPVLYPGSWKHPDPQVRLGRTTVWEEAEDGKIVPYGQKILSMDGEDVPLLEIRRLQFTQATGEARAVSA